MAIDPRMTGGGAFNAPLPNIRDSSKTNNETETWQTLSYNNLTSSVNFF